MAHPPVISILAVADGRAVDAEVVTHLGSCAACRRLAGLAEATSRDATELVTIDPGLYLGREPLPVAGGMGLAVRAWDRRLERQVVIKQLRSDAIPEIDLDRLRERFAI